MLIRVGARIFSVRLTDVIHPFTCPPHASKVCKDGVNRWTDNTWQVKSWMVKTRGMCGADVDKYLQLTGDFDHV